MAEFGKVHRYEPSGALHGLLRVRHFTQDDAHIFCTTRRCSPSANGRPADPRHLPRLRLHEVAIKLSTRPANRIGSDETWDVLEHALSSSLDAMGPGLHDQPWRGRLLRAEARIRPARRDRSRLAVRHAAG
jgi:threonyl-tRNA synthetase (EC 6.1.1.3)/Ser-tRNA(Thr) hydrolase (EC 3.1.1.-)